MYKSRYADILLKTLFVLFALYALLFFSFPPLVKYILKNELQKKGVELAVDSFGFEPLSAKGHIKGLSLSHKGAPLVRLKTLEFDISYYSAAKRALIVDSIVVDGLRLNIDRDRNGVFGFEKIFTPSEQKKEQKEGIFFALHNISINDLSILFEDKKSSQKFLLEKCDIRVPFLSTVEHDSEIFLEPSIKGVLNGSKFSFWGKTRPLATDKQSEIEFRIEGLDISLFSPFLPKDSAVRSIDGEVSAKVKLLFKKEKENSVSLEASLGAKELVVDTKEGALGVKSATLGELGFSLPHMNGTIGSLCASGINLSDVGGKSVASVGEAVLRESKIDLKNLFFGAKSLRLSSLDARVQKKRGVINLPGLSPKKEESKKEENSSKNSWRAALERIEIDGSAKYEDDNFLGKKPYSVGLESFFVSLSRFDTGFNEPFLLSLDLNSSEGSMQLEGSFDMAKKSASGSAKLKNIKLDLLDRLEFLPLKVRLYGTEGSFGGEFRASFEGEPLVEIERAVLDVRKFALYSEKRNSRLLSFETLHAKNIKTSYPSLDTQVEGAALSGFYANLKIDENKTLNLVKLLSQKRGTTALQDGFEPKRAPSFELKSFSLQNGSLDFEDRSLKNRFQTSLTDITGSIGTLSLDRNKSAKIELRANSGGYGRIAIDGSVVPQRENFELKLKASTIDIPLKQFTPYTEKFIGYKIGSGALGLELNYEVHGRKLEADNKISLFGFNLGEEVESDGAVKLPYNLAIAILKDDRGNIDIELPVEGSLDDPEIKSGAVVWKLIKNLVVKIVKAPFSALASLFGGSDELGYTLFEGGDDAIGQKESEKLKKSAEILNKKGSLKVVLKGFVDPASDIKGYKEQLLRKKLLSVKTREEKKEAVSLSKEEIDRYIKIVYKESAFPKPKNLLGFDKSLSTEDMRTLILVHTAVGAKEMEALAKSRAGSVKRELVRYGVSEGRIEIDEKPLSAPQPLSGVSNARVEIGFGL